jgi:tetratricopeptide (TPR) repeat protein
MPLTGKMRALLSALILVLFSCSQPKPPAPLVITPDFNHAESLYYDHPDSAFYLFNQIAGSSADSLEIAMAYNYMAMLQFDAGDYFGSQETLLEALRYLDPQKESDRFTLMAINTLLGSNSLNLKHYETAIRYYEDALDLLENESDKLITINNLGVVYQKKRDYAKAIGVFESVLTKHKPDSKEYARVLSNLARAKWQRNPRYNAAPELHTALYIRKQKGDKWGLNASYSHLADYYMKSRPDSAIFYARAMYSVASSLNSADDKLEAMQKILELEGNGLQRALFGEFLHLSDSLHTARSAARNQFALVRYEAEKARAENLRLLNENAEHRWKLILHQLLMAGMVLFFLLLLVIVFFWYRRRQQQIQWKYEQEIREQQLNTSQKVHDVVANGLYRVMSDLEYRDHLDKSDLLDKLEDLYEKSRDISYEPPPVAPTDDFQRKVSKLLQSFSKDSTRIYIVGNDAELWKRVDKRIKSELEHVLQEFLVNMKKHSQAQTATVKFELRGNELRVQYTDDGVGVGDNLKKGNGIRSTENRIGRLNGTINFESSSGRGLKILVQIPIR